MGYGKVVNISSGTALKGTLNLAHYAASKAALIGFTKSLAREVGASGVTVNSLAPGNTLSEDVVSDELRRSGERTAATRAIPRQQIPDDVLGAMLFLSSPASDFMTGQTVVVDGGAYMH
jgi:3-oxoacyl-[acyl-carrier protein] reductase